VCAREPSVSRPCGSQLITPLIALIATRPLRRASCGGLPQITPRGARSKVTGGNIQQSIQQWIALLTNFIN
jgi:hypothetical protein